MLSIVPEEWGPQLHVHSGSVTRTRIGPKAITFTADAHFAILLLTPQPERIMTLNSDKRRLFAAPAGTLELVPAGAELFAEWRHPKENFLFALSPERLRQLAIAEYDDDGVDFACPQQGYIDSDALRIAGLLEDEFRRAAKGAVNEIYLDSLLTVFSTHLLRRYGNSRFHLRKLQSGGLSAPVLRRVEEFIQAHLSHKISIAELAAIAGLSPSHFNRAFRETTGQPPYQYITRLRLLLVEKLAREHSLTLGEIASVTGFSTHSQMTAIMRRYWGVTPRDIRRHPAR